MWCVVQRVRVRCNIVKFVASQLNVFDKDDAINFFSCCVDCAPLTCRRLPCLLGSFQTIKREACYANKKGNSFMWLFGELFGFYFYFFLFFFFHSCRGSFSLFFFFVNFYTQFCWLNSKNFIIILFLYTKRVENFLRFYHFLFIGCEFLFRLREFSV